MTRPGTGFPQWVLMDEGWGRKEWTRAGAVRI